MNKRKLLGLLCLMTLLATSCDNKGDYWGAMESSKATLTLERICDMATLSQDSVELLSNILGMNTEELYRTDVVMIGKVKASETGKPDEEYDIYSSEYEYDYSGGKHSLLHPFSFGVSQIPDS